MTVGKQWNTVKPLVEKRGFQLNPKGYAGSKKTHVNVLLHRRGSVLAVNAIKLGMRYFDSGEVIRYFLPYLQATNATIVVGEDGEVEEVR